VTTFLQLLFTGVGIGAIYALVSLGFVLLIRAAGVVNFAQGEFSMLGAYIMVVLLNGLGVPYLLSFVLAIVLMAAFGIAVSCPSSSPPSARRS
jgi:branched-chain amino acid transport system permease protein